MIADDNIPTLPIAEAIDQEPALQNLPPEVREKFSRLIKLVVAGQSRMNLTAIRNPQDMVRYHLADSVHLARAVQQVMPAAAIESAVDIGTGAGFPLLPMAILWPQVDWIGIESVQKKARFVEQSAKALSLENVWLDTGRAEEVAHGNMRGLHSLVTARAVGLISGLLEVGLPLLRIGGIICLFKTEAARGEWDACKVVLNKLGAEPAGDFTYRLEGDQQQRVIFMARKVNHSPAKYPRPGGAPFHKPLVAAAGADSPSPGPSR